MFFVTFSKKKKQEPGINNKSKKHQVYGHVRYPCSKNQFENIGQKIFRGFLFFSHFLQRPAKGTVPMKRERQEVDDLLWKK